MPSNNSAREPSGRKQSRPAADIERAAQTAATPTVSDTPALPPTAPDTAATGALWAALTAKPGATAAELAEAADVSRSTANKRLALLGEAGLATRTPGGREGSKRLPDTWRLGPAQQAPPEPATEGVQAEATHAEPEPVAGATDAKPPKEDDGSKVRLGSGQLREMVLNHLRAHPDQEFTPSTMGKLLTRSSGAISNACESLLAFGLISRTSEKPRRYRFAASNG